MYCVGPQGLQLAPPPVESKYILFVFVLRQQASAQKRGDRRGEREGGREGGPRKRERERERETKGGRA